MRATHWILGCALCLAFMGSAAAASLDTQGVDNATHAATSQATHDSDGGGGDVIGTSHDSSSTSNGDPAAGTSRTGNDHSGAAAAVPAPAPRPHLGWQSLLPGSIQ